MAKRSFVKSSVLKVGVHESPDGIVDVTPARLKHWANEHKRLTKNRLIVPAHWDHSDKLSMLSPISERELREKKTRSAKNTVGKMLDFVVSRDGQSAQIKFETFDPKAADGFDNDALHVSPVILPEFKDGKGNEYSDVLTHLDFVNYPVDHSQGPAIPLALRFGLSKSVYRLADDTDGDDEPKKKKKKAGDSGGDDTDEFDFGDDDDEASDDSDTGIMDQSGDDVVENPDMPPQPTDNSKTEAILAGLTTLGIVLPSDFSFSAEGSLDIFLASLNTLIAAQQEAEVDDDPDPNDQQQQQQGGDALVDPTIQTMSLRTQAAFAFAQRKHREEIAGNLETILKSGRCTPAEYAARKKQSGAVKLSLDASGNATQSDVEKWIESRKAVPEGTFWDEKAKTQNAKRMATQPGTIAHPSFVGDESEENADEVVDRMFGRKPADD